MTITDPNYRPDAPPAFVTQPGNALDHLGPAWTRVDPKGDRPAYAYFTKQLERSQNDDREYRCAPPLLPSRRASFLTPLSLCSLIMLENGLEAIIVSDPKTDKGRSLATSVYTSSADEAPRMQRRRPLASRSAT